MPEQDHLPGLWDLWASGSADLYAVGHQVILRFDGSSWREIPGPGGDVVWGTSRDDVFILYRDHEVDRDFMIHGRP